jgi:hypothetical protein
MPDVIATSTVTLHQRLSPSCELIQPATLIQYKQYEAVALPGASDEIYSPELRKGDFVALSTAVPKEVAKSAKKSGFEVRAESSEASGLSAKPMATGSSCSDSQQAIADANNRRHERRVELQTRLRRVGFDVLPPVPIQQVQPESARNQRAAQSSGKPKVKGIRAAFAMLTTLAVSNYRSLRNVVLPIQRLSVITGANGSGKSNVYRALRLVADTAQGRVVWSLAREGGLQSTLWAGPEVTSRTVRRGDYPEIRRTIGPQQ